MSINRYIMELRRNPQKRIRIDLIKEDLKPELVGNDATDHTEVDLSVLDDAPEGHDDLGCGCNGEENGILHSPEHDQGSMPKQNLFLLSKMSDALHDIVNAGDSLPPWMEQKITTAFNEIEAVYRHAQYEKAESDRVNDSDLEEDLSISSTTKNISEQSVDFSDDVTLVEEAKDVVLEAQDQIKTLATLARGDHARMTLSKTSRQLREIGIEVNAVVERLKRSGGMR